MSTVVTTLAHGCFAGFLGYALGRARFTHLSAIGRNLFLLGGLVMAATLNGIFTLLQRALRGSDGQAYPWRGAAVAAGFAAVVFAAVWFLMRQPRRRVA